MIPCGASNGSCGDRLEADRELTVVSYFFPFAGQSNARRHFTDSTPTGAGVFSADVKTLTGATSVTTLNTAVGGSASDQLAQNSLSEQKYWFDVNDGLPGPLLVDAVADIKATGLPVTGIIWSQGEQDAASIVGETAVQITASQYVSATEAIFAYFRAQLGDPDLPIYIQQLGATTRSWQYGFDEIRAAQVQIANGDPDVHIAAVTYDLPLGDTVHLSASGYQTAAHRLAQFVAEDLGAAAATFAHGPRMTSAALASGDTQIVVTIAHDGGTDFAPNGDIDGFLVRDDAGFIAPTAVERISPTQIRLSFAEALAGDVTVWYIRDGFGWDLDDVVRDNSPLALPLEPGVLTATAAAAVTVVRDTDFDSGNEGFIYQDDAFRGTVSPVYASGSALDHGALEVRLGGIDGADIVGMSGGWLTSFNLVQASDVAISFRYNLTISGTYEADEFTEVLLSLDGQLKGLAGIDYVAQLSGDAGGSEPSTGWQVARLDLGSLAAGPHTLAIGGYNNKKTTTSEESSLLFDDVVISATPVSGPVNNAPIANPDTATTTEDAPVTLSVLGNDSDPDGDSLVIPIVSSNATKGWVTVNGNTLVYNPGGAFDFLTAGQSANDTFSYTISDGKGGTDTATVTITVTGAAGDGKKITVGANAALVSTGGDAAIPGVAGPTTLNASDLGFLDGSDVSRAWLGELTSRLQGSSVNAVSALDDGTIVFSASSSGTLDGVGTFTTSDLIAWDAKTNSFSLFFDGSAHGLVLGIDAVHVNDDGSFFFSVTQNGSVAHSAWPPEADEVRGNQIWRFDPSAAWIRKFALVFDGQGEGLSSLPNENIDALHVHDNGIAVISVTGSGSVVDSSSNPLSFRRLRPRVLQSENG